MRMENLNRYVAFKREITGNVNEILFSKIMSTLFFLHPNKNNWSPNAYKVWRSSNSRSNYIETNSTRPIDFYRGSTQRYWIRQQCLLQYCLCFVTKLIWNCAKVYGPAGVWTRNRFILSKRTTNLPLRPIAEDR